MRVIPAPGGGVGAGTDAFVTIAAADTPSAQKLQADYVLTGTNDDITINAAIAALTSVGGEIIFLAGTHRPGATIHAVTSGIGGGAKPLTLRFLGGAVIDGTWVTSPTDIVLSVESWNADIFNPTVTMSGRTNGIGVGIGSTVATAHGVTVYSPRVSGGYAGVEFGIVGSASSGDNSIIGGYISNGHAGIVSRGFTNNVFGTYINGADIGIWGTTDRSSGKGVFDALTISNWREQAVKWERGRGLVLSNIWYEHTSNISPAPTEAIRLGSHMSKGDTGTYEIVNPEMRGLHHIHCMNHLESAQGETGQELYAVRLVNCRGLRAEHVEMTDELVRAGGYFVYADTTCAGENRVEKVSIGDTIPAWYDPTMAFKNDGTGTLIVEMIPEVGGSAAGTVAGRFTGGGNAAFVVGQASQGLVLAKANDNGIRTIGPTTQVMPTVPLKVGTNSVSAASYAANIATITTAVAHGLSVGDSVWVSGITPSGYNSAASTPDVVLTVPSSTTFTVYRASNPGAYSSAGQAFPYWFGSLAASSASVVGTGVLTITTPVVHPFIVGDSLRLTGFRPLQMNGTYTVASTPTGTTLTVVNSFYNDLDFAPASIAASTVGRIAYASAGVYGTTGAKDVLAAMIGTSGRSSLWLPGTYDLGFNQSSHPNAITDVTLRGSGIRSTYFTVYTTGTQDIEPISTQSATRWLLEGFTIAAGGDLNGGGANDTGDSSDCLDFDRAVNCTFRDLEIVAARNHAIALDGKDSGDNKNPYAYGNLIERVTIDGTPPAAPSAPTTAATGTGTLASQVYNYAYTVVDALGRESARSADSSNVTPNGSQKVRVTIAAGAAGTKARKIYRKSAGQATRYLVATIWDNTTTTYDDDAPDALLSAAFVSASDVPSGVTTAPGTVGFAIGADGINLLGTHKNTIRTCAITQCRSAGLSTFRGSSGPVTSDHNEILQNHVFANGGSGIRIETGNFNRMFGNFCTNNAQLGGTTNSGIHIKGSATGTTEDNIVEGNHCYDTQASKTQNYGLVIVTATAPARTKVIRNLFQLSNAGATAAGNKTAAVSDAGTATEYEGNSGWVTRASGTDAIASGTTSKTVTHGLAATPSSAKIRITLLENPTSDPGNIWVDTIGATTFAVNCRNNPGASNLDFAWEAAA